MALSVVPSVGAESYISVATADAFHLSRGNAAWAGLGVGRKEELLRLATDMLEARYAGLWVGQLVTPGQGLQWPRINYYPGVLLVDPLVVPVNLAKATAQLALELFLSPLDDDSISQQVLSEKVGPITVTYSESSGSSRRNPYALSDLYLSTLIRGGAFGQTLLVRG